jgi:zinc transporter ZupT
LLAATAVHSFLDGWSVRALSGQPLTNVAVTLGLALHKVPEGLALGWIARRASSSTARAALAAGAVELLTLAGAFIEPRANESGSLTFGTWWTAGVLTVISGSFLFLGFHALWPSWRRPGVVVVFVTSLLLVGLVHHG